MTAQELDKMLCENVLRVRFVKRTNGAPRDMLCTKSLALLRSSVGRLQLRWFPPKASAKYTPFNYNLTIVWDIRKRDYRTICCDHVVVEESYDADEYRKMLEATL